MINLSYWSWFFKGDGAKPGYKRVINRFLLVHLLIGFIISLLVNLKLYVCASTVLLPLAGIFIGLSFAWVQNAQSLLQSKAIIKMTKHHEGGFNEYVFSFQTSILVILIALIGWGFAGLQIFDELWPTSNNLKRLCL